MAHLYFCRHGQTVWNVENKICGVTDIELTELGHRQAEELGKRIKEEGIKIDELLYSPLSRAAETARHISEITGIMAREEIRLKEQNFGRFESTPRDGEEFRQAKMHFVDHYSGGESMLRFCQRIYNLLDEIEEGLAGDPTSCEGCSSLVADAPPIKKRQDSVEACRFLIGIYFLHDHDIEKIIGKEVYSMTNTQKNVHRKELVKRYILFVISLFIAALGVAITQKGELGVSPISSVANILSLKLTALTLGNWLILWNCILIAGQILLLKKKFQWIQLLQIPLSFLFGYFTDFWIWIVGFIDLDGYLMQLLLVITGTIILSFGVSLSVIANVIMNSGEAFVKALSDTTKIEFGNIKIMFDIFCVISAVVLSLLLFEFKIEGTREGTVIAAICTGSFVKIFLKYTSKPVNKLIIH